MDLNRVVLIGHLARDPQEVKLPSGSILSRFALATNRVTKDSKTKEKKELVSYHDISAWGKLGGICQKYLKKGSKIYLEGRLENHNWEDKNKTKHYKTEVVADNMIMLDKATPKVEKQEDQEEVELNGGPF